MSDLLTAGSRRAAMSTIERLAEQAKCVHTEHCCATHGCKYGDDSCPAEKSGEGKAMKTDIEYAALVMGERVIHDCNELGARITGQEDEWNPLHDDGDSRRLEIACLNWIGRVIECPKSVTLAYVEFTGFVCGAIDIQPEQYRAAVFALAVAIGKVMEGNNNAD
jgi:hypothetical protein